MTYPSSSLRRVAGAAVLLAAVSFGRPAFAQTAAAQYQRVLDREQAARDDASTAAPTLRSIAVSYEAIVRKYPRSGYADNALWQAAGLREFVSSHGGTTRDRDYAVRLLTWLTTEYPKSSLVAQAQSRIVTMGSTAVPAPFPAVKPATSSPVVTNSAKPAAPLPVAAPAARLTPLAPSPAAAVSAITRTALPTGDRITIELNQEATYSARRDTVPDRILYDVANANIPAAVAEQISRAPGGALVKSVRVAPVPGGGARLALDLSGRARYSTFPLYHPFRLVIDVESDPTAPVAAVAVPTTTGSPVPRLAASVAVKPTSLPVADLTSTKVADTSSRTPPSPVLPANKAKGEYPLARQLGLGVSRIVIDAGHGGRDPGALGDDVSEADVVLDVAIRLEKLLRSQPGMDVVLTRRTDEFIPLEQRTAIANRENADLFLSIHANAGTEGAHGVETYFLNLATTPHAEAVAARENATSVQTMGVLPEIVRAITLNNKLSESREFATMVQSSLVRRLAIQNKAMKDLGVKQAPFQVLVGARMPSVLAEIAFVTNQGEAALIKQAAYRQRVAQALYEAVLRYQGSLKKSATVAQGD